MVFLPCLISACFVGPEPFLLSFQQILIDHVLCVRTLCGAHKVPYIVLALKQASWGKLEIEAINY